MFHSQQLPDWFILEEMNPYEYTANNAHFNIQLRCKTSAWVWNTVEFPAAFQFAHSKSNSVCGDYFHPPGSGKAPLVILLHGVGDVSMIPCRWLARSLAGRGIASFVPRLVVHSSRLRAGGWRGVPHMSDEEWFESYRTAVVEVRQLVDWAGRRDELDEKRVGVLGVSFGSLISAIAMAVDERITAAALIVSGGNSGKIVQKARAGVVRKGYQVTDVEYRAGQQDYLQYLAEVAEKGFEDVVPSRISYLNDPMTYTRYLRERPLMMINARWDEFIPPEATLDFWEACNKPSITWLPTTHSGIWLWYPSIKKSVGNFFESAFSLG